MALPKINDSPKYSMKIPSTNKTVTFRPFIVKEQKILLMAMESQDNQQILRSVVDTIESCVITPINTEHLTTFDIEYMFTQIRSKSVGEVSTVRIKCSKCKTDNKVDIALETIKPDMSNLPSNKIVLNDHYTLVLKYPSYLEAASNEHLITSKNLSANIITLATLALDKLLTEDEAIDFADESFAAKEEFVENLTTDQFKLVMDFIDKIPVLTHVVEFKCIPCGEHNSVTLKGIGDFF